MRAKLLRNAAAVLRKNANSFAILMATEMGKAVKEGTFSRFIKQFFLVFLTVRNESQLLRRIHRCFHYNNLQ